MKLSDRLLTINGEPVIMPMIGEVPPSLATSSAPSSEVMIAACPVIAPVPSSVRSTIEPTG